VRRSGASKACTMAPVRRATAILAIIIASCTPEFCPSSGSDCPVADPCHGLHFTCSAGHAEVHMLAAGDPIVGGVDALASPGDLVLSHDQITVVIDGLTHPHYVAPTGGNVLDLVSASGSDDSLTHLFHAVGLL